MEVVNTGKAVSLGTNDEADRLCKDGARQEAPAPPQFELRFLSPRQAE